MAMTLREFHNGLRILRSIDMHELVDAGVFRDPQPVLLERAWRQFSADPYSFFIRADDNTAAKLWEIIEKRTTR